MDKEDAEDAEGSSGFGFTLKCEPGEQWRHLSAAQQKRLLQKAHVDAMNLGATFWYHYVAYSAMTGPTGRGRLWSGTRTTFQRFSMEPLLLVGLNMLMVLAIISLCIKQDFASLTLSCLLLAIGCIKGRPFGSASCNRLAFLSWSCLGAVVFMLHLNMNNMNNMNRTAVGIFVAIPLCFFLHLQLMPGDPMLRAYQLLDEWPDQLRGTVKLPISPVLWPFEKHSLVKYLLNCYRQQVRRVQIMFHESCSHLELAASSCLRAIQQNLQLSRASRASRASTTDISQPGAMELQLRPQS